MRTFRLAVCMLLAVALALPAGASDGRHEISQAGVLAAGGFPYVITQPGSYLLTSDLTPPANVVGIRIDTDDVSIDLNGFAIRGGLVCVPGSCTGTGPTYGIAASPTNVATGRRCTVRNGTIKGAGIALELRDDALVEGLSVSNTSNNGIVVGARSLVRGNRVSAVGRSGLVLGPGSGYLENVIGATGQFFTTGSVLGGTQVGRNACDDGRCPPRRRFYLTSATTQGNQPKTACEPGFHFASPQELSDATQLQYFSFFAAAPVADGGVGPPPGLFGWVRDGMGPIDNFNCLDWASAANGDDGTALLWHAAHVVFWAGTPYGPGWTATTAGCQIGLKTWCVED